MSDLLASVTSAPWESIALYITPLAAGYVGYKIIDRVKKNSLIQKKKREMKEKAIAKRLSRDNIMHKTLLLAPKKLNHSLINVDGVELTDSISRGVLSATDVLIVSAKRSHTVGKDLFAVTEECYDDAYVIATGIEGRRINGKISPNDHEILLGVPISIKDGFQQKGYDCSMGIAARCFRPYPEDGLLVKALKDAGAVPFVRSNIPQLLMMPESENIVWGVCANPWDPTRTSGGSSGGEASLISARCSVSGLGSDIGGSIRIPAHYTGICGFKPTPMRMSARGQSVPRKDDRNGQIAIRSTCGPMARR
jgi:fatty acid amide hydrolase